MIDDYHRGLTPLIVPLTLIKHYVRMFDVGYIRDQVYLNPHPEGTDASKPRVGGFMATEKQGVILVGHGGIPKDCPPGIGDETEAIGSPAARSQPTAIRGRARIGYEDPALAKDA